MTRAGAARNPRAGVTLLELLLALALMAAMALALASVLGVTGRALARVGAGGAGADILVARLTLRGWIEGAPRSAAFAGTIDGLSFDTLIDDPPYSAADLTSVRLARDPGGAVAAAAGEGARRLVLSPAGDLRISYFGRRSPLEALAWHPDWPASAGPPDLVRIEYTRSGEDLPPLTAIPALEARQGEMSLSSPLPPG